MPEVNRPGAATVRGPTRTATNPERSRAPWEFKVLLVFVAVLGVGIIFAWRLVGSRSPERLERQRPRSCPPRAMTPGRNSRPSRTPSRVPGPTVWRIRAEDDVLRTMVRRFDEVQPRGSTPAAAVRGWSGDWSKVLDARDRYANDLETKKTVFNKCQLDAYKVGRAANEEVIILRNAKGQNEEYDDLPQTIRMRQVVRDYNALLSRQLIDIRRLDHPWIELSDGTRLMLGPSRQHVKRVFNRSSFTKGGRFFGPWWQGCPKEWRREIFINDAPTIEQDYSSLHIALLYARRGINYYETFEGDAYRVERPDFLSTPEQTRRYAKLLLLMAVNARTDKEAYAAFRSDRSENKDKRGGSLTNDQLAVLLDSLRHKHPAIADDLGSDAGIELMYEDSRITEHVVKRFTEQEIPVLTVHDSYIVNFGYHQLLHQVLEEGFFLVTGLKGIKAERTGVAMGDEMSWEKERLLEQALLRSSGYRKRLLTWMTNRNHDRRTSEVEGVLA